MIKIARIIGLLVIGLSLFTSYSLFPIPQVFAADDDTLYMRIKNIVELDSHIEETTLPVQRFSIGVFHDFELKTRDINDNNIPFEIRNEEYPDDSLQTNYPKMCGDEDLKNDYMTCLIAQNTLRTTIERNAWLRKLGRDLQAIVSGYEVGIDGYPAKPVDIISRFSSINHLWRAANDPFTEPFLEVLTRARPWPVGTEDDINDDAEDIVNLLKGKIRKWKAAASYATEKKDKDDMIAAMWRYRHGVQYVIDHEGLCANAPVFPDIPENLWLKRRWCDIEEKLSSIRAHVQTDRGNLGNDQQILYPSFIDKENNIYIWMRYDDVGLQWYIPLEPVQAALYHPDFGDCLAGDSARNCYDTYSDFIVRGGNYPNKQGDDQLLDQPLLGLSNNGSLSSSSSSSSSRISDPNDHAVVPEPKEGEGICSHPFSKRGYLCRRIEYEACDLTDKQQQQLTLANTGGIVLTQCQPERFKDDVARKTSSNNICGIGGWKETVSANLVEDTPERQLDMRPNKCSSCAVDIVCSNDCVPGKPGFAKTSLFRRNDVLEICIPKTSKTKGMPYFLMAHELIHAQQNCNESNLQTLERIGLQDQNAKDPAACCATEREAYFVQCKLYAMEGILDKAGVTIDQCASAYANFSCEYHDDDPDDEDYVCTNDGIKPGLVAKAINNTIDSMAAQLNLPETCEAALDHPRIKALYNSFPLSCKPGCQTQYQNTIGNNLCYTGQCLEETREFARDIPGRMGLTTVDEDFPWDSCEFPDPNLGGFEAPPALTAPRFPLYRPALVLQELDKALCQINGLPARTPPIICGFDSIKRIGLPPLTLIQSVDDLALQPKQYDSTGLGIQYAASAIGSRIATDMFTQYIATGSRQFTDLLNTMYHVLDDIGNLKFPTMMCPRYAGDDFSCQQFDQNR